MDYLDPRKDTVGQRNTAFSRTSLFQAYLPITGTMASDALSVQRPFHLQRVAQNLYSPLFFLKDLVLSKSSFPRACESQMFISYVAMIKSIAERTTQIYHFTLLEMRSIPELISRSHFGWEPSRDSKRKKKSSLILSGFILSLSASTPHLQNQQAQMEFISHCHVSGSSLPLSKNHKIIWKPT